MNGIYVLIIQLSQDTTATIGALGAINFKQGLYAYVGSAQNNMEARIRRHFKKEKRKFWHIDHFLDNQAAKIVHVFFKQAEKTQECAVAEEIGKQGEAVKGFGCSDCHCRSHLFRLGSYEFLHDCFQNLNVDAFR